MPIQPPDYEPTEEDAKKVRDLFIEIQAANYSGLTTYTTVIVFGGFAGLFALWSHTKDSLSEWTTYLVGTLAGTSIFLFVSFEIFRVGVSSWEALQLRDLLVKEYPPRILFQKREDMAQKQNLFAQRFVLPIWVTVFALTVFTGLGAGAVLLWSFISGLFP